MPYVPHVYSQASLAARLARLTGEAFVLVRITETPSGPTTAEWLSGALDAAGVNATDCGDLQDDALIIVHDDEASAQATFNAITDRAIADGGEVSISYVGKISGVVAMTSNAVTDGKAPRRHRFDAGMLRVDHD